MPDPTDATGQNAVFNPQQPDRDTYVLLRQMDVDIGWLGWFFGAKNASVYIVGFVAVLLVIAGVIASLVAKDSAGAEVWKILAPPISAILGYLFGRKT